jgi:hypothetical protein
LQHVLYTRKWKQKVPNYRRKTSAVNFTEHWIYEENKIKIISWFLLNCLSLNVETTENSGRIQRKIKLRKIWLRDFFSNQFFFSFTFYMSHTSKKKANLNTTSMKWNKQWTIILMGKNFVVQKIKVMKHKERNLSGVLQWFRRIEFCLYFLFL